MILRTFFLSRWHSRKGSVLILAFWAMGFLSVFAVYMGYGAKAKLSLATRVSEYGMLRHIAKSGIAKFRAEFQAADANGSEGVTRAILAYGDILEQNVSFGRGKVIVQAFDAERHLNINTAPRDVLQRLIKEACSVADADAQAAAEAIIDWRDADSSPQPNGAEDAYYNSLSEPYDAKDALFNETDELLLVRGITGKMMESLSSYVTVCGAGAVNINTAESLVLRAIGLDNRLVDKILRYRAGDDGQAGTQDDPIIAGASDFDFSDPGLITLTPEESEVLRQKAREGLLGTRVDYVKVISRAFLAGAPRDFKIQAVYRVEPKEDGRWGMELRFWRTGL